MELNGNLIIDETLKPIQQDLVDYYCDINLNAMCRVCLEKNQPNTKMFNIFDAIKTRIISSMIMSCSSVQILAGDGLPNTICQKCMTKLTIAWQFKHLCENSDAKLRQFYNNSQHLQVTPDLDGFNISLKQEENLYMNKTVPINDTNFVRNNIILDINNDESHEKLTQQGNNKLKVTKKSARQKSDKSKEQKIHQCDTCGKTFNRREYLTQHIRIHTGEKPYHCHLCEKRFVNSGHLTTHMRTHTGERPHACTICPKAFSTRQELQKHIMVHNGERPFVCKMCGKRFGSSSNLYSHLKHHTGEKNFTCEHCGKAFYTKQELKQHQVVHTGEKAFLCEFCNKRFSQIAHLRRHSKLHKQ